MSHRSWNTVHRRGDVLRAVVEEANIRLDGALPLELAGVAETFGDELDLIAALQLRWHTRLAGSIERALMDQPMELEAAVIEAWRTTAQELAGVRMILDAYAAHPTSAEMEKALATAGRKDWVLLAAMAGRVSASDERAVRIGHQIEQRARAAYNPMASSRPRHRADRSAKPAALLSRLRARLAA